MSDRFQEILSREELDALLAQVRAERSGERDEIFGAAGEGPRRSGPLARALLDFAIEEGRQLSSQYQQTIRISPLGVELASPSGFAGAAIEFDQVLVLTLSPGGERGALLIGRSLLFGWLNAALGGRIEAACQVPDRANSAIEARFLRQLALELTARLERSLAAVREVKLELGDLLEPGELEGRLAERLWVASFDVSGFGDVARLRLALPASWADRFESGTSAGDAVGGRLAEESVREVPIQLRAEVGGVDLSLRRLAELRVGDTLLIDPVEAGPVLVRLEDTPRFRAMPGAVGNRLAIRLEGEV